MASLAAHRLWANKTILWLSSKGKDKDPIASHSARLDISAAPVCFLESQRCLRECMLAAFVGIMKWALVPVKENSSG